MKYGALTIDTSIFDRYNLSLDTEPLASLAQFKGKPVGLLLVDVVLRELLNHLAKHIDDQSKAFAKAGRVARFLELDPSLVDAIEKATSSLDPHQLATDRLADFLADTGAAHLKSGDHVSVDQLLGRYFNAHPPFAASGKKKSEFPDAICLLALEAYARDKDLKILAVSGDGDWKDFADQSEWIDFEDDLSAALAHFHPQTSAYNFCYDFIAHWDTPKYGSLLADITNLVENEVQDFDFAVDASSALSWEAESLTVQLDDLALSDSGDPEIDIKVINLSEDAVTFKVRATLDCALEGEFSLSVYDSIDKDYTRIGLCTDTTHVEVDAEIFVRVSGDLDGPVRELDVDTVDVTPIGRLVADFGHLEPDWHEDDYA